MVCKQLFKDVTRTMFAQVKEEWSSRSIFIWDQQQSKFIYTIIKSQLVVCNVKLNTSQWMCLIKRITNRQHFKQTQNSKTHSKWEHPTCTIFRKL